MFRIFLESQYSQLCAMCEHPDICDYPDNYSGYEGALRCLATNGGQVAFTKVIYVRKFFGVSKNVVYYFKTSFNYKYYHFLLY